jgi:phosphohistidine phosphatase
MGTLVLFRHAKAEQPAAGQDDFDRALTGRGRADAAAMGDMLAGSGIDLAVVSPAARTRETWAIASARWKAAPAVEFDDALYLCRPGTLIGRLQALSRTVVSVVLVGHNPCWQEVSLWLAGSAPAAATMRTKFPTAAVAVFTVTGSWTEIEPARAKLERFATPEMLG